MVRKNKTSLFKAIDTNEKVLHLMEAISRSPASSQRALATETGFSLGLVNLILKRLLQTGILKMSALSKGKIKYILTPKGLIQKTRLMYSYMTKTIRTFRTYQQRIESMIREESFSEKNRFAILGEGDLVSLVEFALRAAVPGANYRILKEAKDSRDEEIVLDCRLEAGGIKPGVSVLAKIIEGSTPQSLNRAGESQILQGFERGGSL